MNNNLYCILSYCDNPDKIGMLKNTIETIKKEGFDILVISPISLPVEITALANYFIYQADNPLLYWPEKAIKCWKLINIDGEFRELNRFLPDYGFTVYNQVKTVFNFTEQLEYTQYTFLNYDIILTHDLLNNFNYNLLVRVENEVDGLLFPSLMFFSLKKQTLTNICSKISKDSYIVNTLKENPEYYLSKLTEGEDYKILPEPVNDLADFKILEDDFIWNYNIHNSYFKLFYDSEYLVGYDLNNKLTFNIDGVDLQVQDNFIVDLPKINFGYYSSSTLIDMTVLLKPTTFSEII